MKRIFSLFVVISVLVISVFPVSALQVDRVYESDEVFTGTMEPDGPLTEREVTDNMFSGRQEPDYFPYVISNPDFKAYSLLNTQQKKIYDAIKNAEIGTFNISVPFSVGEFKRADFTSQFLTQVMNAVCFDLPQIFYHAGYSASYSYTSSGYITQVNYNISMYDGVTYNSSTVADCYNKMMAAAQAVPVDTSNRYNFIKSVHDYLCNNIIYPDTNSSYYVMDCHDPYGALVTGYAVCQGYAESIKLLCDMYNVPCVYISGTGNGGAHGWNAVQMDDGYWYLIDATWDDQREIFYDFFLVGLNTKDTYFGGKAFSVSHVNSADLFLPSLRYASGKYSQTNHSTKFQANFNSKAITTSKRLVCSPYTLVNDYVYYHGMSIPVAKRATGSSFKLPSGENWTLVILGDSTGDGVLNYLDYTTALNKLTTVTTPSTAYDTACDMDCDGALDVLDLANMYRATSGFDDEIIIE